MSPVLYKKWVILLTIPSKTDNTSIKFITIQIQHSPPTKYYTPTA